MRIPARTSCLQWNLPLFCLRKLQIYGLSLGSYESDNGKHMATCLWCYPNPKKFIPMTPFHVYLLWYFTLLKIDFTSLLLHPQHCARWLSPTWTKLFLVSSTLSKTIEKAKDHIIPIQPIFHQNILFSKNTNFDWVALTQIHHLDMCCDDRWQWEPCPLARIWDHRHLTWLFTIAWWGTPVVSKLRVGIVQTVPNP